MPQLTTRLLEDILGLRCFFYKITTLHTVDTHNLRYKSFLRHMQN